MLAFTALTYYMGIVKKDLITSYCRINSKIATLFPRVVMSRNEFENIFAFLYCCDKDSPRDFEILGWCPAGPVLPHGEKVPL